jgi:hypothetical protein
MQAGDRCAQDPRCFFYRMENRTASASVAAAWPGMRSAVQEVAYDTLQEWELEATHHLEPIMLMSTFCLVRAMRICRSGGLLRWTRCLHATLDRGLNISAPCTSMHPRCACIRVPLHNSSK